MTLFGVQSCSLLWVKGLRHTKHAALEGVFRHLPLVVYRCVNLGSLLNICNHNIYNMLIC